MPVGLGTGKSVLGKDQIMNALVPFILNLKKSEKGATAVEYGIMVAGIAIAIIATVFLIGPALNSLFQSVLSSLK